MKSYVVHPLRGGERVVVIGWLGKGSTALYNHSKKKKKGLGDIPRLKVYDDQVQVGLRRSYVYRLTAVHEQTIVLVDIISWDLSGDP